MSTSDGLGALLARAREQRGLSQREVALRLNLAESTIHGLEGGDFHRLGAPIYVRSYLARYARLLGLPEEEVISRFRALDTSEPPPLRVVGSLKPQAPISDSGIRWFSYLVVFVLVGVLGWFGVAEMASRFDADDDALPAEPLVGLDGSLALPQPSPPKPATAVPTGPRNPADGAPTAPVNSAAVRPPAASPAPSPFVPSASPPSATGAEASPAPPDAVAAGASAPATAAFPPGATLPQEAALPPGAASAAPETPAVPKPALPQGHARLVMAFAKDCWVDVKDAAGNRLAYGIMKGDTVQNLSGRAPFSVVLGNATVVNLELNGRPVDKSVFVPRRGTVSKFVLDVPRQDG